MKTLNSVLHCKHTYYFWKVETNFPLSYLLYFDSFYFFYETTALHFQKSTFLLFKCHFSLNKKMIYDTFSSSVLNTFEIITTYNQKYSNFHGISFILHQLLFLTLHGNLWSRSSNTGKNIYLYTCSIFWIIALNQYLLKLPLDLYFCQI